MRARDPESMDPVRRASRMIFLNKTCYNGLYRVNSRGQFNVPFGRYKRPRICDEVNIRAVSRRLRNATLGVAPFESVLKEAKKGDFVYLDPPYQPLSDTARFTAYTAGSFFESDQHKLADVFAELDRSGCRVMLSNSSSPLVRRLYRNFHQIRTRAARAINSVASRRGMIDELLILNYVPVSARQTSRTK
jgi:DNA adenine methylase